MMLSNIEVVRFSDVCLEIHTVGYPEMGESIVVLLKESDKVLLNIITDSYHTEVNTVETILENNGRPCVDIFVWTHPDEDHSVGICDLLDNFDSKGQAKIYMPSNLSKDLITSQAAQEAFDYLMQKYNRGQRYRLTTIGVDDEMTLPSWKFILRERQTNRVISGSLTFLQPESSLTQRRGYQGAKNAGDINDFSIVYVLELNGIRYFFGGDMTHQSIQFLSGHSTYLDNIRYIKIPHHGSKKPIKLADLLSAYEDKKAIATTTVFKDTHPYEDILDKYGIICKHVSSTHRGEDSYGSIQLNFSLSKMIVPEPIYRGNACQVRPDNDIINTILQNN